MASQAILGFAVGSCSIGELVGVDDGPRISVDVQRSIVTDQAFRSAISTHMFLGIFKRDPILRGL